MAQTVCVILSSSDRQALEAVVAERNRRKKHVEQAQVVLASETRDPVQRVASRLGVSRPMIWRWRQRFSEEGADGLLRDKTRNPGKAPIDQALARPGVRRQAGRHRRPSPGCGRQPWPTRTGDH